jgi:hypothetical protein
VEVVFTKFVMIGIGVTLQGAVKKSGSVTLLSAFRFLTSELWLSRSKLLRGALNR